MNRYDIPQPYEFTDLRRKLDITYREMAQLLNTPIQTLMCWENGRQTNQLSVVLRFRRLQAAADHLLARRSEPDWTL